jgi:hypothetical protein
MSQEVQKVVTLVYLIKYNKKKKAKNKKETKNKNKSRL